jgi:hypothetical protein
MSIFLLLVMIPLDSQLCASYTCIELDMRLPFYRTRDSINPIKTCPSNCFVALLF